MAPHAQPLLEGSTPKAGDGAGERTVPPEETLRRVRPFFSTVGITRVANVTGMDHVGIPTVIVTRPNARSLSVSQGKGATLAAARASGVMESIEQWHAERIEAPLRLGSERELGGRVRLLDVAGLPRAVNPYTPDARILWIEGRDLATGEALWLPYEVVHLDLTLPL